MKKYPSYQRPVGEVGCEAIRLVRPEGKILWQGHRYQSQLLLQYVGETIFLWDKDGALQIHEGGFDGRNKPITWGKWICDIKGQ